MKLSALIGKIPGRVYTTGNMDVEIETLCVDSRKAAPGALFFCTPGLRMDAHEFAPQAVSKGAVALIVQRRLDIDVPQVQVEDVRTALSYVASELAKYSFLDATVDVKGTAYETIVSNTLKQEAGQFFQSQLINQIQG